MWVQIVMLRHLWNLANTGPDLSRSHALTFFWLFVSLLFGLSSLDLSSNRLQQLPASVFSTMKSLRSYVWLSEIICLFVYLSLCLSSWSMTWRSRNRVCRNTRAHMQRSLAHPWSAVVTSVTLIRSRSSSNHTYKHAYLCVWCVCVYTYIHIFVCLLFWVYLTAVCLTLCFSSIQEPLFAPQPVVGPVSRHFCRSFIA